MYNPRRRPYRTFSTPAHMGTSRFDEKPVNRNLANVYLLTVNGRHSYIGQVSSDLVGNRGGMGPNNIETIGVGWTSYRVVNVVRPEYHGRNLSRTKIIVGPLTISTPETYVPNRHKSRRKRLAST